MAIPQAQDIHLPLLRFVAAQSGGGDVRLADAKQRLAKIFELTEEEKERTGGRTKRLIFYNRVEWARQYLISRYFIKSTGHGLLMITEKGEQLAVNSPEASQYKDLDSLLNSRHRLRMQEEEQQEEQQQASPTENLAEEEEDIADVGSSPDERVRLAYEELKISLQSDLKDQIFSKEMNPRKFELLALRVLEKIGYGEGEHTGGPGDGGIDGIMNKDSLGFRRVFVQVKHNDSSNSVGSGDIDKFVGSLSKKSRDAQGVFVTSSSFSPAAKKALAEASAHHIVLIDGDRLTELMIKHEIGIRVKEIHTSYDIDKNFWTLDDD